jgi:predicted nucleotide-binding protein (sugar kinase/HSP70/actin superfamily)
VGTSGVPYAALHDIDANKPGGSIKIRVKTYAHSLKLHEEALEDAARKKAELAQRIEEKRLELLRLKKAQLDARRITDPEIERQIAETAEKVRRYEAPASAEPRREAARGLVQLKKKQADGTVVPAGA